MSTSNHYGRSGVQVPAPDDIDAAQSQSQAADNRALTKALHNIVRALIILSCALIAVAICAGILSTTSGPAKIGLECTVGVPAVGHFGVTALQLEDIIRVEFLGILAVILGMLGILVLGMAWYILRELVQLIF